MALGMYAASVPVYQRQLGAISKDTRQGIGVGRRQEGR